MEKFKYQEIENYESKKKNILNAIQRENSGVLPIGYDNDMFVSALIKSGVFTNKKNISAKNIVCGAFILLCGFALSAILTRCSETDELARYPSLSLAAFGIYFIFYPFIIVMSEHSKAEKAVRAVTLVCTMFPSIAAVFAEGVSVLFSMTLVFFGCIALYFIAVKRKKAVRKQP